jgi:hypothetical protein
MECQSLCALLFVYGHTIDKRCLAHADDIPCGQELMLDALVIDALQRILI